MLCQELLKKGDGGMFQKKMMFQYFENYDVSIGMRKHSNTRQIRQWLNG